MSCRTRCDKLANDAALGSSLATCDELVGDGDRHMGIYVSPDNWHRPTCYPHMSIGMLGIYRLLYVSVLVCLSAAFLVTDISGVGLHRAMKFGRMADLGGQQDISPFGELWPRG